MYADLSYTRSPSAPCPLASPASRRSPPGPLVTLSPDLTPEVPHLQFAEPCLHLTRKFASTAHDPLADIAAFALYSSTAWTATRLRCRSTSLRPEEAATPLRHPLNSYGPASRT